MKIRLLFLFLFCVFLYSCQNKTPLKGNIPNYKAGVILSFDDDYINDWYEADQLLRPYSWKATFCVSKINTLTCDELNKLKNLQHKGHEIACHGYLHLNAKKFVAENGIQEYLKQEIDPMLVMMQFYSLKATTFAYPFGFRNAKTDAALLNKFSIIRGTTYGAEDPSEQNCYFDSKRVLFGIGIDSRHPSFSIPYLKRLLEYARKNNKIIVFYGHKTVSKAVTSDYQTEIKTLLLICNFVNRNNMKFYTLSNLDNLQTAEKYPNFWNCIM